jgi:hypothetical protein
LPVWLTDAHAHCDGYGNTKAHSIAQAPPDTGSASWPAFGDSEPFCYGHEYSKRYRDCHAFSYRDCDAFSYRDCYSQCNCFNHGYADGARSLAPIIATIRSLDGTHGVSREFRT